MTRPAASLFLFLVFAVPLEAAFRVGTEQPVSTGRQGLAATGDGAFVSGTSGEVTLVAWRDWRGPQAMRFDSSGRQLDPVSIPLPMGADAIFWNGRDWVLIGNGTSFVRLAADGTLIDREPHPLDVGAAGADLRGAAWTGGAAVVVTGDWTRKRLEAWTFDADLRRTGQIYLGPFAEQGFAFTLRRTASNGSSALFLYVDERTQNIRAALFDRSGQLHEDREIITGLVQATEFPTSIAVGSDGSRYAVVYQPDLAKPAYGGFFLDGELRKNGSIAAFSSARRGVLSDNLVFDGTNFTAFLTVAFDRTVTAYSQQFDAAGKLIGGLTTEFQFPTPYGYPVWIASAGAGTVALYGKEIVPVDYRYELKARAAATPGAVGDAPEITLSFGPFPQTAPTVATSDTQSVVAWREQVSQTSRPWSVYATRVDGRGTVVDPQSIFLGRDACPASLGAASDGRDFLVAWPDNAGIAGALVREDGTAAEIRIDRNAIVNNCSVSRVSVASNRSMYLAVWQVPNARQKYDLYAVRIATDGTVLEDEPVLVTDDAAGFTELLASNGHDFLIVSGDHFWRFGADGVPIDSPVGLKLGSSGQQLWWNGTTYVVAELDPKGGAYRFRRIGSDGSGAAVPGEAPLASHPINMRLVAGAPARCDDHGCTFAAASVPALASVYTLRFEDDGTRIVVTSEKVPGTEHYHSDNPDLDGTLVNLGLAGASTPFLVYARNTMDMTWGGATRVFVRPLNANTRVRAVAH